MQAFWFRLEIDNQPREGTWALRWNQDGSMLTLYHNGRRITRSWKLHIEAEAPADPQGGNANTEEG